MKIVIDDKIPYLHGQVERLFDEVVYLPGAAIGPADVRDADALMVRTRTRCDRRLLEGSRVRFVATATIGYDHLDTAWLDAAGIGWTNCPGCNATSVAQYVESAVILMEREGLLSPRGSVAGIVGAGHVGGAVAGVLRARGYEVLLNDPPREAAEGGDDWHTLEEIAERCDVVTLHTPLTRDGRWPTYHLAGERFFNRCSRCPVVINAARGAVVDTAALLRAMDEDRVRGAVIDTWEGEPDISRELLKNAFLATPHIAGYSADGKANASRMALEAVCRHFGRPADFTILPPPLPETTPMQGDDRKLWLYDPRRDSDALKAAPEKFEWLRGHYPLRREK